MICVFVSGYLSYTLSLSLSECWKEVVSIITPQTIELIAFFIIVLENRVCNFQQATEQTEEKVSALNRITAMLLAKCSLLTLNKQTMLSYWHEFMHLG